jgi:hypothetical protein
MFDWAMLWLRRLVAGLSPLSPGFERRLVHVGFVVGRVALRQVLFRVLRGFPSVSFNCGSPYSYIVWGMNIRPVGCRSSET